MPIVLGDLLSPAEAQVMHDAVAALGFGDGARTAGHAARAVKDNRQAAPGPATDAVLSKLRASLTANPAFQAIALPRSFGPMLISRTDGGGQYGEHVDNALMGEVRADLSFTLFLSPPDRYEGGALTIVDKTEERRFKLGQGEAIVYPSDTLHRVEPVTAGCRFAVVGWIQSWISDPRERSILFDLWQAMTLAEATGDRAQMKLLSKSRSNLIRMWAK